MVNHPASSKGSAHILIVEDNEMNMELSHALLEAFGFRVGEAFSSRECMDYLAEQTPDLILMDLQLPDVDGYTLVELLRREERFKSLPIVALTAYAMKGDHEKAIDAGCTGVITKPIDTRSFPRQVEAYLQGFSEQERDL